MVSQTFFFQVCFCFFKGPFPTSPLLFGNGPDPCRQTGCALDAGIRNDDHQQEDQVVHIVLFGQCFALDEVTREVDVGTKLSGEFVWEQRIRPGSLCWAGG